MILIVTNRQDYTADFLILELQRRGSEYIRFNTEDFPEQVRVVWTPSSEGLTGSFLFPKRKLQFSQIHSIWYRRPVSPLVASGVRDPVGRDFATAESQAALDGIWRCLNCFWVSHPDAIRRAELKLLQLQTAMLLGFKVPATLLTNSPQDARAFSDQYTKRLIYKPLQRARIVRGEEVHIIYTHPVGAQELAKLENVAYCPSLLQEYVPKRLEIRVTVIGQRVFPVEIHSQDQPCAKDDWRRADAWQLKHLPHVPPPDIESMCADLVRHLGLSFGAIDLVLTPADEYVFLEINANGQWAWIQQLCPEIPLREALADLLINGSN